MRVVDELLRTKIPGSKGIIAHRLACYPKEYNEITSCLSPEKQSSLSGRVDEFGLTVSKILDYHSSEEYKEIKSSLPFSKQPELKRILDSYMNVSAVSDDDNLNMPVKLSIDTLRKIISVSPQHNDCASKLVLKLCRSEGTWRDVADLLGTNITGSEDILAHRLACYPKAYNEITCGLSSENQLFFLEQVGQNGRTVAEILDYLDGEEYEKIIRIFSNKERSELERSINFSLSQRTKRSVNKYKPPLSETSQD